MHRHTLLPALTLIAATTLTATAQAQQPSGWIGNGHTSAYTLGAGEFELSGGLIRVDDTIDFLDLREDLLSGNSRLIDNSGDLDGQNGELRLGIWHGLELFYQQQEQDMVLKVGPSSRANIVDLDQELRTTSKRWGAKWMLYEASSINTARAGNALALEVMSVENSSRDFGGRLERFQFSSNISVSFDPPQRFAMDRLKDDGWQARLIYSLGLGERSSISLWAGYGESDASSGTSTEIDFAPIQEAFLQTFDISEEQYMAGISLNLQALPRLPIQIGYEYININKREAVINSSSTSNLIPSFLRGSNLAGSATANHTAYGRISWWVTPHLYASLGGKLFKNQFVGVMPHFNNPLSASFSDTLYGYVTASIGFKFTR